MMGRGCINGSEQMGEALGEREVGRVMWNVFFIYMARQWYC